MVKKNFFVCNNKLFFKLDSSGRNSFVVSIYDQLNDHETYQKYLQFKLFKEKLLWRFGWRWTNCH